MFTPIAIPESEAELVAMRGVLNAYEIPHFVHNRHFGGLYPGNPAPLFTLQRIMVSVTHVSEAKQLLEPFFSPPLPYETERRLAFRDRARGVAEFLLTGMVAVAAFVPAAAAEPAVRFIKFPVADSRALGQVEKLNVSVDCSWIVGLKNIPELYNIEMNYDMPTQNLLEARPRLGGAAVSLSSWSGVIGVRIPADADAKSCFAVVVTAEGRTGTSRKWSGRQLGLPQ